MSSKQLKKTALQKYDELLKAPPSAYSSKYAEAADRLSKELSGRDKFRYDAGDPGYRQFKNSWSKAAKAAAKDTAAEAKALSGGYGAGYIKAAGDLAYADHLKNMSKALPEFEDAAFDRYISRDEQLKNSLDAALDTEKLYEKQYSEELAGYYDTLKYWARLAGYMR